MTRIVESEYLDESDFQVLPCGCEWIHVGTKSKVSTLYNKHFEQIDTWEIEMEGGVTYDPELPITAVLRGEHDQRNIMIEDNISTVAYSSVDKINGIGLVIIDESIPIGLTVEKPGKYVICIEVVDNPLVEEVVLLVGGDVALLMESPGCGKYILRKECEVGQRVYLSASSTKFKANLTMYME